MGVCAKVAMTVSTGARRAHREGHLKADAAGKYISSLLFSVVLAFLLSCAKLPAFAIILSRFVFLVFFILLSTRSYAQGILPNVKKGDTFAVFVGGPGQGFGTYDKKARSGGGLVAVFRQPDPNNLLTVDELVQNPDLAVIVAGSGGGAGTAREDNNVRGGHGGGLVGGRGGYCGSWGGCGKTTWQTRATQTAGYKRFAGRPPSGSTAGGGAGWWGGTGTMGNGINNSNSGEGGSGHLGADLKDGFVAGWDTDKNRADIDWGKAGDGADSMAPGWTPSAREGGLVVINLQ